MVTGQCSTWLRQLSTSRCNNQERNEAPDGAEYPGVRRHQSTASWSHHTNTQVVTLATDKVSYRLSDSNTTFKVRSTNEPAYLGLLISLCHPEWSLMFSRSQLPGCSWQFRTATGASAFSAAATLIWNNLRNNLTTSPFFDSWSQLKTHLFTFPLDRFYTLHASNLVLKHWQYVCNKFS